MTEKHKLEAREIRLSFPCGCLDAHTGGGMTVEEYTCESHRAIALALSSRDNEIREVLEGLRCTTHPDCWCASVNPQGSEQGFHKPACLAARVLWERVRG